MNNAQFPHTQFRKNVAQEQFNRMTMMAVIRDVKNVYCIMLSCVKSIVIQAPTTEILHQKMYALNYRNRRA